MQVWKEFELVFEVQGLGDYRVKIHISNEVVDKKIEFNKARKRILSIIVFN